MESSRTIEIVQCLNCKSVVPKRLYCRKCGKVLLDATTKTISEYSNKNENIIADEEQIVTANTKSSLNFTHKSIYEQLKSIRNETKRIEDNGIVDLNKISQVDQELLEQYDKIEPTYLEDKIVPQQNEIVEKLVNIKTANELKCYEPGLYVKEIVEKMVKSVKYEVNLVQLLHQGQMTEDIFTRLFNNLADETHVLISRREQSLKEIVSLMNGYESTVQSAKQGMKLLDLRKSIGDASEEEFVVKSSALNWDIENYGNKILDGQQKSDYLKHIGKLIPENEINELENIANIFSEDAYSINVSEAMQERIMTAMQEVALILREAYTQTTIQYS